MSRRKKRKQAQPQLPPDIEKLQKQLKEQKGLYELAQKMLMQQIIRFIEAGEWSHLKQFCHTYCRWES